MLDFCEHKIKKQLDLMLSYAMNILAYVIRKISIEEKIAKFCYLKQVK